MSKFIHWYPGHIAKAQRQLKEKLNLVDVIIEVIDSRIPYSSWYKTTDKLCSDKPRIILMNKSDVSDNSLNKKWSEIIKKISNCDVIITSLKNKNDTEIITKKIVSLASDIMEKRTQKGLLPRAVRTMVIGMPNVGKSSTINRLVKRAKTKTGAKAGVTRQQQWVRINEKIELLDTPGIIPTTQDDQFQALKLACVNSVGENSYDSEIVAQELLKILNEKIAFKKNWILKNGIADTKRASQIFLSNFRDGKIGNFTLENPEEYELV